MADKRKLHYPEPKTQPKFVQVAATCESGFSPWVYALDEDGHVWEYITASSAEDEARWVRLSDKREEQ
jgi:hypothetical protein